MSAAAVAAAAVLALVLVACAPPAHAVMSDETPAQAGDEDLAAGRRALERRQWDEAVVHLRRALVRHPDDPDLHNHLGYAYRHLRRMDAAFEHYRRAIALDPRHRSAYEYLGEAYLMVDDVAGAERQVAALRAICLLPCEELADLENALARHRAAAAARPAKR